MKANDGLKTVLLRNAFYRDNYYRALLAVLLVAVLNVFLLAGVIYQWTHPPQPQYFATTPDGKIIMQHPLSDPVLSDDFVLQWATDAVRSAF